MPLALTAGNQLLTFGGDCAGEASQEICLADISNLPGSLDWQEPVVKGGIKSLPSARKGMAGVKKGSTIYLFSGLVYTEQAGYTTSNEMYTVTFTGGQYTFTRTEPKVDPINSPFVPKGRAGATLQELPNDKNSLLLFGGTSVDGKPFFDAWKYNIQSSKWTCVFNGHSELAAPAGVLACMPSGHLATVNAAPGSSKLDICSSLDFVTAKEQQTFSDKMKKSGAEMLAALQKWTDDQAQGLSHPIDDVKGDFDKLLATMAALYSLRTHGPSKELLVDQMQVSCYCN
jgi:hypothetical protein